MCRIVHGKRGLGDIGHTLRVADGELGHILRHLHQMDGAAESSVELPMVPSDSG